MCITSCKPANVENTKQTFSFPKAAKPMSAHSQRQQHYDLSCVSFVIVDYTKRPGNVKEEEENFIFIQLHALSLKQEKIMENCRFKKEHG